MISDGVAEGSLRSVDPFIAAQMLNATLNAAADLPVLLRSASPNPRRWSSTRGRCSPVFTAR